MRVLASRFFFGHLLLGGIPFAILALKLFLTEKALGKKQKKSRGQRRSSQNSTAPDQVELNVSEKSALQERIAHNKLNASDQKLLIALIDWYLWLVARVSGMGRGLGWLNADWRFL